MAGTSLTPLPCGTGLGCPKAMGARPRTQKHAEDGGTEPEGAISLGPVLDPAQKSQYHAITSNMQDGIIEPRYGASPVESRQADEMPDS